MIYRTAGVLFLVLLATHVTVSSAASNETVECYASGPGLTLPGNKTCVSSDNTCRMNFRTMERGCEKEICAKGNDCQSCKSNMCNKYVCYECDNCEEVQDNTPKCLTSANCFINVKPLQKSASRGCSAEDDKNTERSYCAKNLCNKLPAVEHQLTCYNCTGPLKSNCTMAMEGSKNNTMTCNLGQVCYAERKDDKVARGCTPNYFHPGACYNQVCNKDFLGQVSCIVCDSKVNETCKNPNGNFSQICDSNHGFKDYTCYSDESEEGRVVRGCYTSLKESEKAKCQKGTFAGNCTMCLGENCNNAGHCPKVVPSGAPKIQSLAGMIIAVVGAFLGMRL